MNSFEIIALIVTAVGVASFATIFTILYRTYAKSAVAEYEAGKCDVELIDETILSNIKNAKKHRRVLRRVKQVLFWGVLALLVPFMLISLYSKIVDGVAMVNGRGMIAVASGSMSEKNSANPYLVNIDNQFNTYDMIVLQKVESTSDLQLYDVIAYVNDEGVNIIHRIVGFQYTSSGIRFITRGDSNNADDEYKPCMDDVLGEYTGKRIPYIGVFLMFLQSYSGIITVAAVIYCLIMIESMGNKIYDAREDRLIFLQETIDFKTDTVQDGNLDSSFTETVYFKDYAYTFDENGFVSKTLISERSDAQDINFVPENGESNDADSGDGDGE